MVGCASILELLKKFPQLLEESKIFCLLVDGLGLTNLRLKGFKKEIYRTVFPSSTPNFAYSFHSLLQPAEHGFLEWYMRFGATIVCVPTWETLDGKKLELKKDVRKRDVFPFKPLSEILWKKGFSSLYYTPFAKTTFTKLTSKKAKVVKIDYLSQVFPLREADFTVVYWPSADLLLHEKYRDEAFRVEIKLLEKFVEILQRKIPKNSIFFLFSDHGLVECRRRYLLPTIGGEFPVGGGRVAFYQNLEKEEVEKEIRKRKIPASVVELNELEGFEKKVSRRCYEKFGKIVVLAGESIGFKYPFEVKMGKKEWNLASHGGVTEEEMKVHVWSCRK